MYRSYRGYTAEVAGWGVTDVKSSTTSDTLLFVSLPVLDLNVCKHYFKHVTKLSTQQLCAGGIQGKDSCAGDSGGPLMLIDDYNGPPRYYQIGIVSFGATKCGVDKPAVYTNVAAYMKWILDRMSP